MSWRSFRIAFAKYGMTMSGHFSVVDVVEVLTNSSISTPGTGEMLKRRLADGGWFF